jgi:predicted O-methyltransferase YrrM
MFAGLPSIKMESRWPKVSCKYMMPWEQGLLLTMLHSIRPKRMIEMGVNEGVTAQAVLKWIDSIEYYVGIDVPFDHVMPLAGQQSEVPAEPGHLVKGDPRFRLVIRRTGFENGDIVRQAPFDVAFIDGDHSYAGVLADIDLALKIVPPGGWIFYHDYRNGTVEVTRALDERRASGINLISIEGSMLAYEQL